MEEEEEEDTVVVLMDLMGDMVVLMEGMEEVWGEWGWELEEGKVA